MPESGGRRVRIDSCSSRSSYLGLATGANGLDQQLVEAEVRRAIDNSFENNNSDCFQRSSTSPMKAARRNRTISGSKSEDHLMTTDRGQKVYTKGRPPWYDRAGKRLKQPFVIGICGGSASGKTTVARRIIERLEMPWVTVLSMDSFYKVLNAEERERASQQNYNFDHPAAFDFDLLEETLRRLRDGKSVEVPVYDFTTHSRDKNSKVMYGADVLIFEGILSFFRPAITEMMDMKVFVDTDSDTRLARRLKRDTMERGRDTTGVIDQYFKFVKPAFDNFIAPATKVADIIVPRGGDNEVAIDLIIRQVKNQLAERGYDPSKNRLDWSALRSSPPAEPDLTFGPLPRPDSLHIVDETPQLKGLHTIIRNRETPRDEFIFVAERLMQILIEHAMKFIPYEPHTVTTPDGDTFEGMKRTSKICGVAIMRAGETLERSLRGVIKDCKIGKILIQTNDRTGEPELYYLRLPKNIAEYKVLLMDANVATGAAAIMAIRILLDHDVKEENITLLSLLMAEAGVNSIAYAFPRVNLVTTAVDNHINQLCNIIPGMGNFGDRYYGTDAVGLTSDDEAEIFDQDEIDQDESGSVDSAIEGSGGPRKKVSEAGQVSVLA